MGEPGHRVDVADGIARVTLSRKRLDWALMDGLAAAADSLARRGEVRVVILRSDGPDFCHGADLTDPALAEAMREDGGYLVASRGARLLSAWSALPMPSIAVLRGRVIGGGVGLALACDLRVAAPGSTLALPEVLRGIHLGWQIIPRLVATVGASAARWMTLAGEAVPVEGLPLGAVTVCDAPEQRATELARRLAEASPTAVRHVKATLARAVDLAAAGDDAARFAQTVAHPDFIEAMSAWHARRAPRFADRGPAASGETS